MNDFVIIDTSEEAKDFLGFNIHYSDYPIYYIGYKSDSIKIGRQYVTWTRKIPTTIYRLWTRKYSDKNLKILVDTTVKTNSSVEYISEDYKVISDSTKNVKSFLLTIQNISDSVIYLGEAFSLFYINREARDKNGKWVKVDKKLCEIGLCTSNQPMLNLKPNQIVISKIKRYQGSFATDFRMVLGFGDCVVYSNTFRDSIDDRMFLH